VGGAANDSLRGIFQRTCSSPPVDKLISIQLGFPTLPEQAPAAEELQGNETLLQELHNLLVQTQITEGKLVCPNCGHEYCIREGIANFLLPSHLV